MKNVEEFPKRKPSSSNSTPCDLIFKYVDKPADFLFCKCVNVFDNKWRINVFSRRYVEGIEGKYISSSHFVKYDEDDQTLTLYHLN